MQYDRSISIQNAVRDVKFSLIVALVLVVAVIFLFLRSAVATLIPSLTLPLAIIGTFSVMYALDFSIDNLSLMALTLAVGFIVDDAIVMLENIVRHIEMGKQPMQAALEGAQEVGFTVLSMCLSLSAVFIPLMFMGGIIGRLFREFAVTISVAMLVSGFIALTLTPMLCSRLLQARADEPKHGSLFNLSERGFEALRRGYERSLEWVMRHRPLTLVFSAVILALTGVALDGHPERSVPARRHRIAERHRRGGAGHDVHGDAALRQAREQQAGDRHERGVVHGERRQHGAVESGELQHLAQAGRHTTVRRLDGARADEGHVRHSRGAGVRDEPAVDSDRRPRLEDTLSVHAARSGHYPAVRRREQVARRACRTCRRSAA